MPNFEIEAPLALPAKRKHEIIGPGSSVLWGWGGMGGLKI